VHGFFSVPTDPLTARALFVRHFAERELDPRKVVVVAPDVGHAKSASRFAGLLGLPVAAADKTRVSDTEVEIGGLIDKQVQGFRHALIYDDEIATGGSVQKLSRVLIQSGIEQIGVVCTHGLFVGGALQKLLAIPEITEIVTTDTVPQPPGEERPAILKVLSVAGIFGEAIRRNCLRQSIGNLYAFGEDSVKA
jgi:ribose-phosphate pyrophosphokinase